MKLMKLVLSITISAFVPSLAMAQDSSSSVVSNLSQAEAFSSVSGNWQTIWSGSTTGSISIPNGFHTIYVQTNNSGAYFPVGVSGKYGGTQLVTKNFNGRCTAEVSAADLGYFDGRTVRGGYQVKKGSCSYTSGAGTKHQETRTLSADIGVELRIVRILGQK
ncbi:hypothetical protein L1D14_10435 [Vibrio tubiashii]|uniref:hypothetical protein n=1 Tax=Vibrio tubiashii TaxID=29498 RepID=UPI001EFDAEAC|nr:hypothetical protein [Vibrio tubiashii]MCG9576654.1 hypothetical protein [Vibrio tubiashii]